MKKSLGVLSFLFVMSFSLALQAVDATQICSGVTAISLTEGEDKSVGTVIQSSFQNFKNYSCQSGQAYCLCFQYPNGPLTRTLTGNLSLNSSGSGKPVYVVGLNIITQGTLNLTGASPITLLNSNFSGCTNCLSVNSMTPFQIGEGVRVSCSAKNPAGSPPTTGLKLLGDGHNVRQSNISNCNVGIQIGDVVNGNHIPANHIHVETDAIHGNGYGIKVVEGDFNFPAG